MILLPDTGRPTSISQVATRCYASNANDPLGSCMVRTFHYARDNITALQVAIANWYMPTAGGGEVITGTGTTTSRLAIEYPAGVFKPITYNGGAATGSIATGVTKFSDWCQVGIPKGAKFFIRRQHVNATGACYCDVGNGAHPNVAQGDALELTATDKTTSGTITDGGSGTILYPAAIVARTSVPSIFNFGDSRSAGVGDATVDASGDQGEIGRGVGGSVAYINMGMTGDNVSNWTTGATRRIALAKYCTHIVNEGGINDIMNSTSAAALQALITVLAGKVAPRPLYQATLCPWTTGAWTNPTGSDQTVTANEAARVTFNTAARNRTIPGVAGCIDFNAFMENGSTGKWNAPGFTTDGIHETTAALLTILLDTSIFRAQSVAGMNQV